eukprot:scaffold70184_cov35-Tisochrysis_lutea.AAC.4
MTTVLLAQRSPGSGDPHRHNLLQGQQSRSSALAPSELHAAWPKTTPPPSTRRALLLASPGRSSVHHRTELEGAPHELTETARWGRGNDGQQEKGVTNTPHFSTIAPSISLSRLFSYSPYERPRSQIDALLTFQAVCV